MAGKLASYVQAGRAFDPDERAIAAQELQRIDEPDQPEIDAAWDAEIQRRVNDIVERRVTLVSGEESAARVRARLAELEQ
jgi:hypothetical protein